MNFSSCWPFLQMTGRKGRVVSNDDGTISYESRSELDVPVEILNLTEKQRFMDGEKVKKNWGGGMLCQKCLFSLSSYHYTRCTTKLDCLGLKNVSLHVPSNLPSWKPQRSKSKNITFCKNNCRNKINIRN